MHYSHPTATILSKLSCLCLETVQSLSLVRGNICSVVSTFLLKWLIWHLPVISDFSEGLPTRTGSQYISFEENQNSAKYPKLYPFLNPYLPFQIALTSRYPSPWPWHHLRVGPCWPQWASEVDSMPSIIAVSN